MFRNVFFSLFIKLKTVDEVGVDKMRVDQMGVDQMGSRGSGNKP